MYFSFLILLLWYVVVLVVVERRSDDNGSALSNDSFHSRLSGIGGGDGRIFFVIRVTVVRRP